MDKSVSPEKPPVVERKPSAWKQKAHKFLRLLKYFVLSGVILTILEIGVAYWLVSSRWHLLLSKEQMLQFTEEVNAAQPLPENFMRVYNANFPRHLHTTLTQQIFINYGSRFLLRHTELDQKPHCFCDMIYDIQKIKHQELENVDWDGRLQDLEYGFGIEKYSTPEKCFYYVTWSRIDELKSKLNPNQFGHIIYNKVEDLNDDELIELILLLKNRYQFNRYKHTALFEKAFAEYKAKLTESTKDE